MLFATIGVSHCPYCGVEIPIRSHHQILERMLSLPEDTEVEIHAPVFKIYGEDYDYLFDDIRTKGCRHVRIDGIEHDISEESNSIQKRNTTSKSSLTNSTSKRILINRSSPLSNTPCSSVKALCDFDVEFPEDAEADAIQQVGRVRMPETRRYHG